MDIEQLFQDPCLTALKQVLEDRKELLPLIERQLSGVADDNPEIFRRPPMNRIKKTRKIFGKITRKKPDMSVSEFIHELGLLSDIGGSRMTISTRNLYPRACKLISEALTDIGTTEHVRHDDQKQREDSFSGENLILFRAGRNGRSITWEIQVRTLIHDLWEVFDHYESSQQEDTTSIGEDLKNYAKLMEVANDFAKTIREREIREADSFHRAACAMQGTQESLNDPPVSYRSLERVIGKFDNSGLGDDGKMRSSDASTICDFLRGLSRWGIYTESDLHNLLRNDVHTAAILKVSEQYGILGGDFDYFHMLCECHSMHPLGLGTEEVLPETLERIAGLVQAIKQEEDTEGLHPVSLEG